MRRTRLIGAQAELYPDWRYHAFVTDRVGTAVELDAGHRRHAVVELCIRDLKTGSGCGIIPRGSSPLTPPGCLWPRWRWRGCAVWAYAT